MAQAGARIPDLSRDIGQVLVSEDEIRAKVRELGGLISADYADTSVTLVSVLKGSLPFMADLMRAIQIPVQIDLMEVSSYGGATTESSGLVRILKDLSASISGKDVLIVEDIIDTGLTLNYLLRYLRGKNPKSLRICALPGLGWVRGRSVWPRRSVPQMRHLTDPSLVLAPHPGQRTETIPPFRPEGRST